MSPKVSDITWSGYGPLPLLWWVSYTRWTSESLVLAIIGDWEGQDQDRVIRKLGFEPGNLAFDYGMLVAIGIFWRIIAFILLKYDLHRKNKK